MHSSATSIDNPNVDISRLVRLHGPGYDCLEEGTIDFSDTTGYDPVLESGFFHQRTAQSETRRALDP